MRLFTLGPVAMYRRTLGVRSGQLPYFRTSDFSQTMLEIAGRLKHLLETSANSQCAFITGSGTAAMEAVISSSFGKKDRLLIIDGGTFGARFVQLCRIYSIDCDVISLQYDEQLTDSHFLAYSGNSYAALIANINETSTGQLYDIEILKRFCQKSNAKLVIDAISSFLCDELKMDKSGIDCIILSSQKGLALSPGLSMVVANNTFYEENIITRPPKSLYFDLQNYFINMRRGQTPYTPAVGVCLELLDMLIYIEQTGLEKIISKTHRRARAFRGKLESIGLQTLSLPLSNALTPIIFKDNKASEIDDYLQKKYSVYLTPSGGDLKSKMLRVGHFGDIRTEHLNELIIQLEEAQNEGIFNGRWDWK